MVGPRRPAPKPKPRARPADSRHEVPGTKHRVRVRRPLIQMEVEAPEIRAIREKKARLKVTKVDRLPRW